MVTAGSSSTGTPLPSIGELLTVAEVETVVRLDGPGGRVAELVLTGDVASALEDVLAAAYGPSGAGFFVIGPFGSGKSHFLSAVGELLTGTAEAPSSWVASLRRSAVAARRSLPVPVPLVDYRAEAALEDVVRARAWRALGLKEPAGGPTGSSPGTPCSPPPGRTARTASCSSWTRRASGSGPSGAPS